MKKKTKIMICLAVACAGTMVLGACKDPSKNYKDLAKEGYQAIVSFDPNGGVLNNEPNLLLSNVYKYDDLASGKKMLFEPTDSVHRDSDERVVITYPEHFFLGWYTERELWTDSQGRPLDENHELCSETGNVQWCTLSGRWDFSKKLQQSDFEKQEDGSYLLQLYAGWIPYFSYNIVDDNGNLIATKQFDPSTPSGQATLEMDVPSWNDETGKMDYGNFPKAEGKTFVSVRENKDSTENLTHVSHPGTWDKENGETTAFENKDVTYYGVYEEGEWFHIRTAKQFYNNFTSTGCFDILEDLDFGLTDEKGNPVASWPLGCSSGEFMGKIIGNGKKISNISIVNSSVDGRNGGIFGSIAADAVVQDLEFVNASYNLNRGTRTVGASFGLFAGEVKTGAKVSGITVSGTLLIGDKDGKLFAKPDDYQYHIGVLTGNLNNSGITDGGVTVEGLGGIKAEAGSDGSVSATD